MDGNHPCIISSSAHIQPLGHNHAPITYHLLQLVLTQIATTSHIFLLTNFHHLPTVTKCCRNFQQLTHYIFMILGQETHPHAPPPPFSSASPMCRLLSSWPAHGEAEEKGGGGANSFLFAQDYVSGLTPPMLFAQDPVSWMATTLCIISSSAHIQPLGHNHAPVPYHLLQLLLTQIATTSHIFSLQISTNCLQ